MVDMHRQSLLKRGPVGPWLAGIGLLLLYVAVSFTNSTGGYLGTDTGAKVATLDHMVENGTWRPTVGYWAEEWDPQGEFHPLFGTVRNTEGEWTNVTTLPMLVAGRPLFAVGGYRLALLLPMMGAVATAFAARALASTVGATRRQAWMVLGLVGLASPIAVYALDFWEHAVGTALMLTAIVLLVQTLDHDERSRLNTAGAGLLLGAAATMRTETFVVAAGFVGVVCVSLVLDRRARRAVSVGLLAVVGFAVPWFLNGVLEDLLGGRRRAGRASGVAAQDWWQELSVRGEEALTTWFRLPNLEYPAGVFLGVLAVVLIGGALHAARRGQTRLSVQLSVIASATIGVTLLGGLGFVSGALVASPFAGAALLMRPRGRERVVLYLGSLIVTVMTWMFQYTGGALPQWGGRYLLVPTLVLTVLGAVQVVQQSTVPFRWLAGVSAVVTAFGVVWLNVRSHEIDRFFDEIGQVATASDDVVISPNGFFVREAGDAADEVRYLSLGPGDELAGAIDVARASGATTFAVLTAGAEPAVVNVQPVGVQWFELVGVRFGYHRYAFATSD